eukprot:COSAG02_NODE_47383_length_341_cov_1.161157_1_plen_32_part_01
MGKPTYRKQTAERGNLIGNPGCPSVTPSLLVF